MRKNSAVDCYGAVDRYRGRAPYKVSHICWHCTAKLDVCSTSRPAGGKLTSELIMWTIPVWRQTALVAVWLRHQLRLSPQVDTSQWRHHCVLARKRETERERERERQREREREREREWVSEWVRSCMTYRDTRSKESSSIQCLKLRIEHCLCRGLQIPHSFLTNRDRKVGTSGHSYYTSKWLSINVGVPMSV